MIKFSTEASSLPLQNFEKYITNCKLVARDGGVGCVLASLKRLYLWILQSEFAKDVSERADSR